MLIFHSPMPHIHVLFRLINSLKSKDIQLTNLLYDKEKQQFTIISVYNYIKQKRAANP